MDGDIPEYEDICYSFKDKPDCLNLFRKDEVLNPKKLGCKPDLHPDIEFLLNNLCGNKEENVKYIHQAILYKYQNMDDFMMPCVVFHGQGGSGKGTFMNLLSTIL
jgi:phage/plasmid-associated DNA primase